MTEHTFGLNRTEDQRSHEGFWCRCWVGPFSKHYQVQTEVEFTKEDPPECFFKITNKNGTMRMSWGELTGVYESKSEAKRLWDVDRIGGTEIYVNPTKSIIKNAEEQLDVKLSKYGELVELYGPGHLLMLLHSPMALHSGTRIAVEKAIVDRMYQLQFGAKCPFQSIWLGSYFPDLCDEIHEDQKYVIHDSEETEKLIFLKCIWDRSKILQ